MTLATKRTATWIGAVMGGLLALGLGACSDSSTPAGTDGGGAGAGGTGTGNGGASGSGAGGATAKGGAGGTSSGAGGTGTGAGGAGAGGAGAGGASAGDGGSAACNIPCLENLVKACPTEGMCVDQNALVGAMFTSNTCYANGVKTRMAAGATGLKLEIFKAGGAPCWSLESNLAGMLTVKDAAGTVVATGTYDATTMKQTVTCGGQTYDLSMCMDAPDMSTMCTDGTCAVP